MHPTFEAKRRMRQDIKYFREVVDIWYNLKYYSQLYYKTRANHTEWGLASKFEKGMWMILLFLDDLVKFASVTRHD